MTKTGLYGKTKEGKKYRISDGFKIIGNVSDIAGSSYGVVLGWQDDRSRPKQQVLPLRMFARSGNDICGNLMDGGLRIERQKLFLNYVWQHAKTAPKAHLADRVGWFDDARFVLPDGIAGQLAVGGEKVIYAPSSDSSHAFRVSGTAVDWRENIGRRCVGNSRLVLAVCCAFAGPLIKVAGAESGGIHFRGGSSIGKTTAQYVAGSVVGGGGKAGFLRSWRTTVNGLEAVAALHNDSILILDELSQSDSTEVVQAVYTLINGQGKNRMNADGTARRGYQWAISLLSSGELSLREHAGVRTKGGAEIRMLDIEADAGCDMGLFEDIHGAETPQAFANELKVYSTQKYYGTAFREFLDLLCEVEPEERKEAIAGFQNAFLADCELDGAAPEVGRAASRMALLAAAGEVATLLGTTGWELGESTKQVKRCFDSWLVNRGGKQVMHDQEQGLAVVRQSIEQFGDSRFEDASRTVPPLVRDRLGFRRKVEGGAEYLFLPELFKNSICKGFDYRMVLRALDAAGHLRRQGRDMTISTSIPGQGVKSRVYCVRSSILSG